MALPLPKEKQLFRERRRIVKSWHRFYDPETGRYISADPIGLRGKDLNLYSYVEQDPINWTDFQGLLRSGRNDPSKRPPHRIPPGLINAFLEVVLKPYKDAYKHCYVICSGYKGGNFAALEIGMLFELIQTLKDSIGSDASIEKWKKAWEDNWGTDMPYNRGGRECSEKCESCDECCAKKFGKYH